MQQAAGLLQLPAAPIVPVQPVGPVLTMQQLQEQIVQMNAQMIAQMNAQSAQTAQMDQMITQVRRELQQPASRSALLALYVLERWISLPLQWISLQLSHVCRRLPALVQCSVASYPWSAACNQVYRHAPFEVLH